MKVRIFIYLFIITIFFIGCGTNSNEKKISFVKRHFKINIDTTIYGTVLCNNKFLTLKSNGKFVCLNTDNFEEDTSITNKLNKKHCSAIYQIYDSVIVVEDNKDYFINSEFDFIPYNRYKYFYNKNDTIRHGNFGQNFIDPLYCDSNYIITQFCAGEFGGTLYFFDIKNNKEYYCPATCANVVNKINNKYIITNSSVHEDGSSEILEITDPTSLNEINLDTIKNRGNFWYKFVRDVQSVEKHDSIINVMYGKNKKITDTVGLLIYTSFKYQNEIFHIYNSPMKYSDKKSNLCNIYIGKMFDKKIEAIDSFCNVPPIFTYYPKNRIYDNLTLYSFNHREKFTGFLAVKNDTINYIEYIINK